MQVQSEVPSDQPDRNAYSLLHEQWLHSVMSRHQGMIESASLICERCCRCAAAVSSYWQGNSHQIPVPYRQLQCPGWCARYTFGATAAILSEGRPAQQEFDSLLQAECRCISDAVAVIDGRPLAPSTLLQDLPASSQQGVIEVELLSSPASAQAGEACCVDAPANSNSAGVIQACSTHAYASRPAAYWGCHLYSKRHSPHGIFQIAHAVD